MTTEEIVDAARNAGFSSSEITRRIAAFKRLIQYSTSAEREKCTGTQEFVTLPSEVVGQALEAFAVLLTYNTSSTEYAAGRSARDALRAALERPQNHAPGAWNMVPAGWKLVPVEPNEAMHRAAVRTVVHCTGNDDFPPAVYRAMLAAAPQPPVVEQPQQVEMLGETCIDGGKCHHKCTDRCFRRECCAPFSDYSGPWKYEQTQPQGEQEQNSSERVMTVVYRDPTREDVQSFMNHPKSVWFGWCHAPYQRDDARAQLEQPPRQPLTDQQIDAIADAMPGGLEGFMRVWGWRQFSRATESAHNIK